MTLRSSTPLLAVLIVVSLLVPAACDTRDAESLDAERTPSPPMLGTGFDGAADVAADVELMTRLRPSTPFDGTLSATTRHAHVFFATANASVDLEILQRGSARDLDSQLEVWGPRNPAGAYPTLVAQDDDAGYAKLSRARFRAPTEGFYLVVVGSKTALPSARTYRLSLACSAGTCDSPLPVARAGNDVRWVRSSAEYRGLVLQAYATATQRIDALAASHALPSSWTVVLDIDETVLSNLQYQRERAELGAGYSQPMWTAWVKSRAAVAMPGVVRFLEHVHAMGGHIALVSNRVEATECPDTAENLRRERVVYDVMLCKRGTSDKNDRFARIEAGMAAPIPTTAIVLYLGDNIQDFPSLGQDVRLGDDAAYAAFSERFVLLPNPMYGSWERNPE